MRHRFLPRIAVTLLVAVFTAAPSARAQGTPAPVPPTAPRVAFNWVIEGGFELGGDRVIEIDFVDGSSQTLTAGQGGTVAFGGQFRPAAIPRLALGATIGYKFVTNASENASISITRIPIEVVARWTLNEDWWAGAGLTMHTAVKVEGDGFFPDSDFDATLAPTVELGWRWVALTYTVMEYTAPDDETFSASAIGVMFRWVIPSR